MLLKLFHGSFDKNIKEFLPLTHFGSFQSALETINDEFKISNQEKTLKLKGIESEKINGYIYEVTIETKNYNLFSTYELASLRPAGILARISNLKKIDKKALEQVRKEAIALQGKEEKLHGNEIPKYTKARSYVQNFLLYHNIDYIDYINEVEDAGSKSYIIINTSMIKDVNLLSSEDF